MENRVGTEQSWSKTLFGNQHMLHVTSAIAQGAVEFTSPQLERATSLGASSVHRLLGILCSVGLLSRVERRSGERTQRYRRESHPFWRAMSQLRERAHAGADAPITAGKEA
ncbi:MULTISPECIES: hypothetical protein [unclassified Microbacterium]|uniref:hypothetical protein n=1 Tax=unclassified Microbacterium TaxID=2609290 RepID=UPI0021A46692|nr:MULTISPECIES: hypothetical protein [unclassified Microbacterium]MBT9607200.1 hypothetical protein [Microbacterium sp.]MCT1479137.1 hypothetical protein [Microbacterium sp. p3-SID336]MDI9890680.1 hypothetical protein [Microbacterium sp. IEGM 1404]